MFIYISVVSFLEKESFIFCSFFGAQKFPPNFELVKKSYSDLSFSKYHAPMFKCRVDGGFGNGKSQTATFLMHALIMAYIENFFLPPEKVVVCDFPPFKLVT